MKQYINEAKRFQKLAGMEVTANDSSLNESQLRALVREIVEEAVYYSSGDINAVLKSAKAALEAGKEVTVDGKQITKVVPAAGAFFPADGGPSLRIRNYISSPEKIVIDGVPAEIKPWDPKVPLPKPNPQSPEEQERAARAWDDRYGPNGGYRTAFGKYTGD